MIAPVRAASSPLTPSYTAVRALTFVTLLLVIGAVVFRTGVIGRAVALDPAYRDFAIRRAASVGAVAALVLLIACAGRLYVRAQMLNVGAGAATTSIGSIVTRTLWEAGWETQFIAAMGALVAFWLATRRIPGAWAGAGIAAAVLTFTPALGGHAVADYGRVLLVKLTLFARGRGDRALQLAPRPSLARH